MAQRMSWGMAMIAALEATTQKSSCAVRHL
jgi:hypothetical protein